MIKKDIFRKESAALKKADVLGCKGTHKHDNGFMPCESHEEWESIYKTNDEGGEIDELVDFDGTMLSSKIPILDPKVTNPGMDTTDKAVAAGHTRQDPYFLGFRRYVGEEDMSGVFGAEDTEMMGAEETIDYLSNELGVDNAEERAEEMGKDSKLEKKKLPNSFIRMRLQEKEKMFTKEDILRMREDMLTSTSSNTELKPIDKTMSKIILRNLKSLRKLADKEGVSMEQLIRLMKNEQ